MASQIFTGRVFLLVTGASRGIGKEIAKTFGSELKRGSESKVLLLARSADHLRSTADELPKHLSTSYRSVDFSKTSTDELQAIITESLKNDKAESYDQAVIVHCAAMATFDRSTTQMTDFDDWHRAFDLNMFSPAVLNGIFVKTFNDKSTKKFAVNISSYWGLRPDVYVGSYCAAKAAKDMFFKVFALEHPEVNVINYLPGYVDTDMFYDALKLSNNPELKEKLEKMIEDKKYVTPARTIECLVEVLKKQEYRSGDHVDYYKLNQ